MPTLPPLPVQVQQIVLLLAAGMAGLTAYLVTARVSLATGPSKVLADYLQPDTGEYRADSATDTPFGHIDQNTVILASLGLPQEEHTLTIVRGVAALIPFLLLLLAGLPLVPAVGTGALGFVLAESFLKGRWRKFKNEIERELPTFVSRLAGTLQVTESSTRALEQVLETLDEDSPLRLWMDGFRAGVRLQGERFAEYARNEATRISPSLGLTVFMMSRLAETGGGGFSDAFTTVADELSAILEARAVASSKAESARQAVLMMIGIMAAIMVMMLSSPNVRQGFEHPRVQLVAVLALAAMGFGYVFLNSMIDEALE